MPTKLEMVMAYERGPPATMVARHNSHVTNKKVISLFVHGQDNQTRQDIRLMVLGHYVQSCMIL